MSKVNVIPLFVHDTLSDMPFLVKVTRGSMENPPFTGTTFSQITSTIDEITGSKRIGSPPDYPLYSNLAHRHSFCSDAAFVYYCFAHLEDAKNFVTLATEQFGSTAKVTHGMTGELL